MSLRPSPGDIFEHVIFALYSALLPPDGVAVDGGCNVGFHGLRMAALLSTGSVHAFEPAPELFEVHKAKAKGFGDRLVTNCLALGDFVGESTFNYFNEPNPERPNYPYWNSGYSGLKSEQKLLEKGHVVLTVRVTTLDEYFAEKDLKRLDFVKLDIEGGEYHAIKGGGRTLREYAPLIAFEDGGPGMGRSYGYAPSDLPDLFESLGYDLLNILGEPYGPGAWEIVKGWRPWYTLAVPKNYWAKDELPSIIERAVLEKLG